MLELWCTFWGYIRQGDHLERTFVAIPACLPTHLRFDFTIPVLAWDSDFHYTHAIGFRCATWILQ
ncbi:hypothetical protein M422DRAFT_31143 [Sphaerobolus stellatus SS14]|uniref:Uncharacterized protein n=1 Tax=Sphaerobolus stellatus (strain SS14) TaxID=990650 RepID=A0A0C9VWR3_SPHS4|nr:hypothetical protein M422DRAFT_31143 [Sphaerobolus stellatus SS14]